MAYMPCKWGEHVRFSGQSTVSWSGIGKEQRQLHPGRKVVNGTVTHAS